MTSTFSLSPLSVMLPACWASTCSSRYSLGESCTAPPSSETFRAARSIVSGPTVTTGLPPVPRVCRRSAARARAATAGSGWGKAKHVVMIYLQGGPSHLDSFDPKPLLNELAGQKIPESFGKVITAMGESKSPLLASKREWKQHGQSGQWFSDWIPHIASCADDLAVIRSCKRSASGSFHER